MLSNKYGKQVIRFLYHLTFNNFKKLAKIYKADNGINNKILIRYDNGSCKELPWHTIPECLDIKISGNNNIIEMNEDVLVVNKYVGATRRYVIQINASNCRIKMEKCILGSWYISAFADNSQLEIGKNNRCCDITINLCGNKVNIGDDCLISNTVIMWGDGHSVLDSTSGEILNLSDETLTVGNHVWLGERVTLTKRAGIPDNCIVGVASVVTKKFKQTNCLIAGNPAEIRKEGINWDEEMPQKLQQQRLNLKNKTVGV